MFSTINQKKTIAIRTHENPARTIDTEDRVSMQFSAVIERIIPFSSKVILIHAFPTRDAFELANAERIMLPKGEQEKIKPTEYDVYITEFPKGTELDLYSVATVYGNNGVVKPIQRISLVNESTSDEPADLTVRITELVNEIYNGTRLQRILLRKGRSETEQKT